MRPFVFLLAFLAAVPAGPGAHVKAKNGSSRPTTERRLSIFFTGEVQGAVEPCGCTSDPLGDISRLATLVAQARRDGDVCLVDAGGLLYPQGGIPSRKKESADLRAAFLADQLGRLGLVGAALGESDLAHGPERVRPRRLASNLAAPFVEPPSVSTIGTVRLGVLGVGDPALAASSGIKAEDPVNAVRRDAERLRREGAEVVVLLAAVDRSLARRVARNAPVDFVVLGRQVGLGMARAEKVGNAWVVAPAEELQKVGRIDLVLRPGSPALQDAGSPEATEQRRQDLDRRIRELDESLAKWSQGGTEVDPAFVAGKRQERTDLAAERERIGSNPRRPPPTGSYFTVRLVPLRRVLPREGALAAAMKKLDAQIGAANLRAAEAPPAAEAGRPAYLGISRCGSCHKAAVAFWRRTVHARAWKTLVVGGKAADYDCVGCHATGFGEVGGSSLGHTRGLVDVQCEVCHGPASLHVAEKGVEDKPTIRRDTPETTCTRCHNEKHSDTFQYQAYLRDILGKGHGDEAREKLGDGPTGAAIRRAAVQKARALGKAQLKGL